MRRTFVCSSLLAPDGGGAVGAERVNGVAARRPQFAVIAGAGAATSAACLFLNGRSGEKGRRLETERGERRFDIVSFHTFFFV